MTHAHNRLIVLLLACLNVWLGLTVFQLYAAEIDVTPIAPAAAAAAPRPASGEAPVAPIAQTLADLHETLERPLLHPTRKPAQPAPGEAAAAAEEQAGPPPDNLTLIGKMQLGKQSMRALVRMANSNVPVWIAEGGEVGGWHVDKISADQVTLRRAGQRYDLKYYPPDAGGAGEQRTAAVGSARHDLR